MKKKKKSPSMSIYNERLKRLILRHRTICKKTQVLNYIKGYMPYKRMKLSDIEKHIDEVFDLLEFFNSDSYEYTNTSSEYIGMLVMSICGASEAMFRLHTDNSPIKLIFGFCFNPFVKENGILEKIKLDLAIIP